MNTHKALARLGTSILAAILSLTLPSACRAAQATTTEWLGDSPGLVIASSQAWGELGWNVAAHAAGQQGQSLQIAGKTYARGLGHHANGTIAVSLEGRYAAFDAEVGLQPCEGGSVIFRVLVDGEKRFDSGVMRSKDAAKAVHVELAGAQEMILEANDAGDGITCDMADWADARLTRAGTPAPQSAADETVEIARFARVVTWDPERMDGARADRIQEFRAEDVFTETAVPRNSDGSYRVPRGSKGQGCIGLQWLNRRALKTLALDFTDAGALPAPDSVEVQGWFGESAWQGQWKRLAGEMEVSGNRLIFRLSPGAGFVQTQKIRWIMPLAGPAWVWSLSAFTRSRWHTVHLLAEFEKPARDAHGEISIINGEMRLSPEQAPVVSQSWKLSQPARLTLRSSRPSTLKSDPTIVQFRLPGGSCGVGVQDVLTNDCVYLPDYGLFVTRDPAPLTLAEYKRKITGRKTILQQVRELPDQTLAQAMARTHHDAQREGPVMLSLACDNTKFVLERDGTLRFQATTNLSGDWFATAGAMQPQFGVGQGTAFTRRLDGGWLPIPVITAENKGVLYSERAFVAPCDEPGSDPARLNRRSVCVAEFTLTNTLAEPAEAALSLNFAADSRQKKAAKLARCALGYCAADETGPFALAATDAATALTVSAQGGDLKLKGTLPPLASASFAVLLPAQRTDFSALPDTARLRADTEAYWNAVLAPAMQVATPDPLLNDVIRSSQVRCLIAARNEADGARIAPWIAAMSYGPLESEANSVIRGMDFMGHGDFARRGLDFFIHRYNTNGFLTTGYTTFGTAWHLWTLGEHYQLYRDTNWLRQVAPEVERAAAWIIRQTEKTKRSAAVLSRSTNDSSPVVRASPSTPGHSEAAAAEDSRAPEYGLIPPGVLADWNSFAYHFAMNAYYYAALREVGTALSDLSLSRSSRRKVGRAGPSAPPQGEASPYTHGALGTARPTFLLAQAAQLRTNILRAYRCTQSQAPALPLRNGTWIPHYPSQVHSPGKLADFFPGQDGGRSWCYDVEIGAHQLVPTGVFDPHDREVERILDHMEDVQFLSDGWFDYPASMNERDWFNLGGFSKVQPYYTRNCEVYALRDDVKPFVRSYFNAIAAMLNPEVLTLWEHFHHSGAWDKTHETGYFLHQTRTMLVTERDRQLWLAPFVTSNWLKDGQVVAVTNAPTHFGAVSYRIASHAHEGYIAASIEPPTRTLPTALVLRLRHPDGKPMRAVTVNGKRHSRFDPAKECITIKPTKGPVVVRAEY